MEKNRRSGSDVLLSIGIALLVGIMLVLAAYYIGGSRFSGSPIAIRTEKTAGDVRIGTEAEPIQPIYESGLLPVSFIGARVGEDAVGAFPKSTDGEALLALAMPVLHGKLAAPNTLTAVGQREIDEAFAGDFLYVQCASALPYQTLYALTGAYTAPAGSESAASADRLLLGFSEERAVLYLLHGDAAYRSDDASALRLSELRALLSGASAPAFTVADGHFCVSETAPTLPALSLSLPEGFSAAEQASLLSLFGYEADRYIRSDGSARLFVVEPHGSFSLTNTLLLYTAASGSGLPIAGWLPAAKDELDLNEYDILLVGANFVSALRAAAPEALGGGLSVGLTGLFREGDLYTLTFGLFESGVPVGGDAFPEWVRLTVQGGRLRSAQVRMLCCTRSGYTLPTLPASWHYAYAARTGAPQSLFLRYPVQSLPQEALCAGWYKTEKREDRP